MRVNGYTIKPGANLKGANLEGANLRHANLSERIQVFRRLPVFFRRFPGRRHYFGEAWYSIPGNALWRWWLKNRPRIRDTNLSDADLTRADLFEANLSAANLTGANLSHANLRRADLKYADLTGTNLGSVTARWRRPVQRILCGPPGG